MIGDFEIPAVWFQSINALFIILLAPVFSWAWPALARKNVRPGSMTKFVIGIPVRGGGLWPDDAGGAERPEQRRGRCVAAVAGGQHPDADARRTVPEPDWPGDHDPAGAGENARPDDGLWFCASALGNLAAGLIGGHVKADQLSLLPDLFARCSIALLICAAVLAVLIVPVRRMLENSQSSGAQKSVSNA